MKFRLFVFAGINKPYIRIKFTLKELKNKKAIIRYREHTGFSKNDFFNQLIESYNDNYYIVKYLIEQNTNFFESISDDLKVNYSIIKKTVKRCGLTLEYAPDYLRSDYNIVKYAVKKCGLSLKYSSDLLKSNYNLVKYAVRENGAAVQYVPMNFQLDHIKIIKYAIKENSVALKYISEQIRFNYKFIKYVIEKNFYAFQFIPIQLKKYRFIDHILKIKSGVNLKKFSKNDELIFRKQTNYKNSMNESLKGHTDILMEL